MEQGSNCVIGVMGGGEMPASHAMGNMLAQASRLVKRLFMQARRDSA